MHVSERARGAIRPYDPADLPGVLALLDATFAGYFEASLPAHIGPEAAARLHPDWRGDYARDIPGMADPGHGRFAAVHVERRSLTGYLSWTFDAERRQGELVLLAVHPDARREGVARRLCEHALAHLTRLGVDVVTIGTGGEDFHRPARELYETLGFRMLPTAFFARSFAAEGETS